MKVCHFSSGAVDAPYFENIARGLTAHALEVTFVSLGTHRAPAWIDAVPGTRYASLGVDSALRYPAAVVDLAGRLRSGNIQILQTHLFDAGIVGVAAARLARMPLTIVTRHHSDQVELVGRSWHRAMDRWMARGADMAIAVSHAVRDYMIAKDHLDGANIEVIHLGFDYSRLEATDDDARRVRDELGLGDGFLIGCVGQLFRTKGQIYLIQALSQLSREIPDVKLLLVGAGDPTALRDEAIRLGVADRVVFAGHRRDVPACLRAADIAVHPSLSEAFSQVVVEAMAVGTPLVCTDVGGAREVVTDGRSGLLVRPADAAAIAEAVVRLKRDEPLRLRVSEEGRRHVRRHFTVERMVRQQLDCYRRWLERPSTRALELR